MIRKRGFTLIELLVVIAIIGLLASIVLVSLNTARGKARDTKRLSDIRQIIIALEMFYDSYGRYPNNSDGISGAGECVGNGVSCGDSNAFESAISDFMAAVPADPRHNCPDSSSSCGGSYYYYAYDYAHSGCDPVIGFHLFENDGMRSKYQRQDTTSGGDMDLDDCEYNYCLE